MLRDFETQREGGKGKVIGEEERILPLGLQDFPVSPLPSGLFKLLVCTGSVLGHLVFKSQTDLSDYCTNLATGLGQQLSVWRTKGLIYTQLRHVVPYMAFSLEAPIKLRAVGLCYHMGAVVHFVCPPLPTCCATEEMGKDTPAGHSPAAASCTGCHEENEKTGAPGVKGCVALPNHFIFGATLFYRQR